MVVFTHPWSFVQFFTALVLSSLVVWIRSLGIEKEYDYKSSCIYLGAYLLAEIMKTMFFSGLGGFSATSSVLLNISGLSGFWEDVLFGFRLRYGGLMASLVLFCLCVVGVYLLSFRSFSEVFLLVLPAVSSMMYLVGIEAVKARLLFNLPFGVYAACGYCFLFKRISSGRLLNILSFFIFSSLLLYFFRSLANLI